MGGGLMQLVAYGAQDIYLTGNPQITFFKVVYRRHTNFSMEAIEQTIKGSSQCKSGGGTSGTVTISRNGDLVYKVYVTSDTPNITRGDLIVNEVELEIGGQMIDRQYEEWNHVWNELTTPASKQAGLKAMTNSVHRVTGSATGTNAGDLGMVQIPLNFWFCRNPGLALPLIALQYHEVKLKFKWGDSDQSTSSTRGVGAEASCKVFCDYIYLDTDERRRFAQVSHEYLIEQIQKQTTSDSKNTKLNFNHPVKELIWTTPVENKYVNAKLVLNGHDRFSEQQEEYFQLRQPYDYHTAVPHCNLPGKHHKGFVAQRVGATITKNPPPIASATKGIHNTACDSSSINFVNISGYTPGTTAPSGASPQGIISIVDTTNTVLHGFIVGAIDSDSCLVANSIRVGDLISFTGSRSGVPPAASPATTISHILLSSVSSGNDISETSGEKGPLHVSDSGAQHDYLIAGGTATDITDVIGGPGVLVLISPPLTSVDLNTNDVISITNFTHHLAIDPGHDPMEAATSLFSRKINVYSFALKPEEHQPSGTCNFSRIDNAQLQMNTAPGTNDGVGMNIYAVNYNVLRIMSGMGGLAYSN